MSGSKKLPVISEKAFLYKCLKVENFYSVNDQAPYKVLRFEKEGTVMVFERLESKRRIEERLNLIAVYKVYETLSSFGNVDVRDCKVKGISGKQSPVRGLLAHLGLIH